MLICEGIDTAARIMLNNLHLGDTDNMFRRYIFEVTNKLKKGTILFQGESEKTMDFLLYYPTYTYLDKLFMDFLHASLQDRVKNTRNYFF